MRSDLAIGVISYGEDNRLLDRLLHSLAAWAPTSQLRVYTLSPTGGQVPIGSALPPELAERTQLMLNPKRWSLLARPFVIRHMLAELPASSILLLLDHMVLVADPHPIIRDDCAGVAMIRLPDRCRGPFPLYGIHPGVVVWQGGPLASLHQWCDAELGDLKQELMGDPHVEVDRAHFPRIGDVAFLDPEVLLTPRTLDLVVADEGRRLLLADLAPSVARSPWRLGHLLPHSPRSIGMLRKLISANARLLDPFPEQPDGAGPDTHVEPNDQGLRRIYAEEFGAFLRGQGPEPPPGGGFHAPAVEPWTRGSPSEAGLCSRYALAPWFIRSDLRQAFPDPTGHDTSAYLQWCKSQGVVEEGLRIELIEAPRTTMLEKPGALSVVGYLGAVLGLGESVRRVSAVASAAGFAVFGHRLWSTANQQHLTAWVDTGSIPRGDIALVVVNPDRVEHWWAHQGVRSFRGSYLIGLWAWEVDEPPVELDVARSIVDRVWVPSNFTATCLSRSLGYEPWVFRHPVETRRKLSPGESVPLPELVGKRYLLCVLDYHSVMERKNPMAAVSAFTRAFAENQGPQLVIKTINEEADPLEAARLRYRCSERSDIHIVDKYLSEGEMARLIGSALAVLSLHRSEGFGLVLADAMGMAVPVVATAYSGNLDYMNDENALLVEYDLRSVGEGNSPYPANARWAEPSIDHAAELLGLIASSNALRERLGRAAQATMADQFSLNRCAVGLQHEMRLVVQQHVDSIRRTRQPRVVRRLFGCAQRTVRKK